MNFKPRRTWRGTSRVVPQNLDIDRDTNGLAKDDCVLSQSLRGYRNDDNLVVHAFGVRNNRFFQQKTRVICISRTKRAKESIAASLQTAAITYGISMARWRRARATQATFETAVFETLDIRKVRTFLAAAFLMRIGGIKFHVSVWNDA